MDRADKPNATPVQAGLAKHPLWGSVPVEVAGGNHGGAKTVE